MLPLSIGNNPLHFFPRSQCSSCFSWKLFLGPYHIGSRRRTQQLSKHPPPRQNGMMDGWMDDGWIGRNTVALHTTIEPMLLACISEFRLVQIVSCRSGGSRVTEAFERWMKRIFPFGARRKLSSSIAVPADGLNYREREN